MQRKVDVLVNYASVATDEFRAHHMIEINLVSKQLNLPSRKNVNNKFE